MTETATQPQNAVFNLRDYGGYSVAGGGRLRRGLLWRSGHLADAQEGDHALFVQSDLALITDLRGRGERSKQPSKLPLEFAGKVIEYDGETAGLAPHIEATISALDEESARGAMVWLYGQLPHREALIWLLKRHFAGLLEEKGASLVHCMAGKDRTGVAVDLFHHALGVHPDDAMGDFLLTNDSPNNEQRIADGALHLREHYGALDDATVRVLMGVEPVFLETARRALVDEFGSVLGFLEQIIGVGPEQREGLRLRFCEI